MLVTPGSTFIGNIGREYRQVTVLAGIATVEALYTAADGTESWVAIPDAALTGPTSITLHCPPGQRYRVTGATAQVS